MWSKILKVPVLKSHREKHVHVPVLILKYCRHINTNSYDIFVNFSPASYTHSADASTGISHYYGWYSGSFPPNLCLSISYSILSKRFKNKRRKMRSGETRKPEDNEIHPTSTPNNEHKQQQPSCEGSSIERSFSNERSGPESKEGGNGNSMLDIFVDRLTAKLVKRYRLDETKRPENVSNGCGTLDCSNQEKDIDDDDLMVASGAGYDSPALTNEMIEYRKYGLEVANQIQNVVRGGMSWIHPINFS